jgi:hypothetical protein
MSDEVIKATLAYIKDGAVPKFANELTEVPYSKMSELVRHKIKLFGGAGKAY